METDDVEVTAIEALIEDPHLLHTIGSVTPCKAINVMEAHEATNLRQKIGSRRLTSSRHIRQ